MRSLCLSVWFVVPWVFSQHEVEFNVVDLVGRLRCESFLDQVIFPLGQLQLKVVEDRSETGEVDEAAAALVFVLEEWLDQ